MDDPIADIPCLTKLLQEIVGDSFEVAHKPVANNLPYQWEIRTTVQLNAPEIERIRRMSVEEKREFLRSKVDLSRLQPSE